ncbi:hypothetical protein PHLGIDRAFT_129700 [Phlebiopsis gigantea 11061_1 CR5-6]|uniref:Uncharacterized protein n=1 Tax=Phlebiopsis gigantea (strain 11061_1 CR5-6) TaxID=745531 RepID=A0A0C3S328_PHLG1|nr:hypothetical protein PHLGIDRAFT_129700 [Phlebiopsis gigantea 11061_1 CR5-6]
MAVPTSLPCDETETMYRTDAHHVLKPTILLPTPPSSRSSRESSPSPITDGALVEEQNGAAKKKKKKKAKKSARSTETSPKQKGGESPEERPPVLCISRNKHWRYISSYHGPWLQLPVELLESLLVINLDPATLQTTTETRLPALPPPSTSSPSHHTRRIQGFASLGDHSPPDSPRNTFAQLPPPPPLPTPKPGKATPPPIDPGVFRSVTHIRRLIDEASELSVRASSGLSAAALGSMNRGTGYNQSQWGLAHSLGLAGVGENNGRNVAMSAMRIHRLRALAVQKLAAAYKADEIASSVMVMQGGSVFDDIAERVLKFDPNDIDARYVHFFHERIPSRQSTSTALLDSLISAQPHRLEFFRTRGIVHCFRDEFAMAVKDFTYVLREARAQRKTKMMHRNNGMPSEQRGKGKKKKGKPGHRGNGQAPVSGTSTPPNAEGPTIDGPDGEPLLLHPSVLPEAPEPIEPQCLFLRGAAYLQHAVYLIEQAMLDLEGIKKELTPEGAELRLCYVESGKYGGVEIGNPDGPLGNKDGKKLQAYRAVLAQENFREQIFALLRKSIRDHERFLSHFDTLEGPPIDPEEDANWSTKAEYAFLLSQSYRPGSPNAPPPPLHPDAPIMFTTYHPLLVESHFSILIAQIMLGDFASLIPTFYRSAMLVDGLEGYPVFLPPRSMSQAEFIEILERLAGGWRTGIQPHSLMRSNRLTIELYSRSAKAKTKEIERPLTIVVPEPIHPAASSSATTPVIGVNGSSSSSAVQLATPPSGRDTPATSAGGIDLVETLDWARMLLVPVAAKQRERTEKAAAEKATEKATGKPAKKKPLSINIPLHGPRVEIVMAWLGAVHLVELDAVA